MNTPDLEELERLLAKATPGEWRVIPYYTGTGPDEVCRGMLAVDDDWPTGIISETDPPLDGVLSHDLDLIVALHNAAPSLIAKAREADELRAENERLRRFRDLLADLQALEAEYRLAHDLHGDGSRQAGRAWDLMRRAGDEARAALGEAK